MATLFRGAIPNAKEPVLKFRECNSFVTIRGSRISFRAGQRFGASGEQIDRVYVVEAGLISSVIHLATGDEIETAMVGRGGLVGASALASARWPNPFVAQSDGTAWTIAVEDFSETLKSNSQLHDLAFRHVQWLLVQAQQAVGCNAKHTFDARLCSWLLRAQDLSDLIELPFTQEVIAKLLGARRPTASVIAAELRQQGLIDYSRGKIVLRDRDELQRRACECYGTVRERQLEIIGSVNSCVGERPLAG
jgi:CRP-like cAMP-binding protein